MKFSNSAAFAVIFVSVVYASTVNSATIEQSSIDDAIQDLIHNEGKESAIMIMSNENKSPVTDIDVELLLNRILNDKLIAKNMAMPASVKLAVID